MRLKINISRLLEEAEFETDLVPYFAKLFLRDCGVPVVINPCNIKSPDLEVLTGTISHSYNVSEDEFSLIIDYIPEGK